MNKFLILVICVVILSSCYSSKLTKEEQAKFSLEGQEVFYEGKAVAKIGNFEYEYLRGRYHMEVSLVQYSGAYNEMTEKIVRFMATKYPKSKIEVKVIRDDDNDQPQP